jgi:large subunit ribosomal protein L9
MKVILNKDMPNLGEEGDVCDVANGYARNFLIPRQIAVPYNKQTLAMFEQKRSAIEKRKEEKRQAALSLKERLEAEELELSMPSGESGRLFGSVNNATVAEALGKVGIDVDRRRIEVPDNTLKQVGNYVCRVRLYDNEEAELKVKVTGTSTGEKAESRQEARKTAPAAEEAPRTETEAVAAETTEEATREAGDMPEQENASPEEAPAPEEPNEDE